MGVPLEGGLWQAACLGQQMRRLAEPSTVARMLQLHPVCCRPCVPLPRRGGAGSMRVVAPAAVPDGQPVVDAGYMGAPTVGLEKLDSDQAEAAVQAVLGAHRSAAAAEAGGSAGSGSGGEAVPSWQAAPRLAAIMAGEVGGGNGLEPLMVASKLGLPVVDGDLMGRAFPELQVGGEWWWWVQQPPVQAPGKTKP